MKPGARDQVSIVVVSYNAETYLEPCLSAIANREDEVIVVDSGSTDGSRALVRDRYPGVRLIELEENKGYGAAVNEGLGVAQGRYLLVLNCDAWPVDDAIKRLAAFAEDNPSVGVVGPRLLNPDGTLQRSVRGYPTLWRLATEYFFLRWLAPRSRLLNAFYGANFDHNSTREAEFLVGAVLFLPRAIAEELGGFDTSFFMFNEEVDLCYRIRQKGWRVVFFPEAEFVHVGGAYTRTDWPRMYREQLRSHLRFLAKHYGLRTSERGRKLLLWAMRLRWVVFSVVLRGERARLSRESARWLRSATVASLLASKDGQLKSDRSDEGRLTDEAAS
jgi:N-acetylglucosaminyl-diphospho-decaprenol L-rhamnosyltransferase